MSTHIEFAHLCSNNFHPFNFKPTFDMTKHYLIHIRLNFLIKFQVLENFVDFNEEP